MWYTRGELSPLKENFSYALKHKFLFSHRELISVDRNIILYIERSSSNIIHPIFLFLTNQTFNLFTLKGKF
jgi:hypothetical protein